MSKIKEILYSKVGKVFSLNDYNEIEKMIFSDSKYKIIDIKRYYHRPGLHLYWIIMDCPVMPEKVVAVKHELKINEKFNPHFNNDNVICRFPATEMGWLKVLRIAKL